MGERLVVTTMKDEGPFILEWVAWYLMLGFDHIVILYNDCTDHSPWLLTALDAEGLITALPYAAEPDRPVKQTALRLIREHPRVQEAEWVFPIDVDEFLVIHKGDGLLEDLIDAFEPERTHGIAVHWRCFGSAGYASWSDELTHRRFLLSSEHQHNCNVFFKTLIRWPRDFKKIGVHSPRRWNGEGSWGTAPNLMRRCDGRVMRGYHPNQSKISMTPAAWITHEYAQLNHYAVRTPESYALKRGTPSSAAGRDRYTEAFYRGKNRNEIEDDSALKYADRFDAVYEEITSEPKLMRLHHQCCMDYVERLGRANGFEAKDDPRWQHHRTEAARLR
ncbi:glycosyltransferase family 2 protein [Celeribacter neptunius]|uniref:Glycosyl transferase family 2 n=1 Tax=Celeribacter neptunius TaxID=588602 RepID=A0A1I3Y673_9RHOB|nr:glycosyltransferase family 2 protein [Celeribacter neptunius]SFK27364.1 Glycosyl transferase family 2 [Celeribacter neptunius]